MIVGSPSKRKPYNRNAGYVASLKCHAPCGGHIVIYDRANGFDYDCAERWIVVHEPFGLCIPKTSIREARKEMKMAASGRYDYNDILYPGDKE